MPSKLVRAWGVTRAHISCIMRVSTVQNRTHRSLASGSEKSGQLPGLSSTEHRQEMRTDPVQGRQSAGQRWRVTQKFEWCR